MGIAGAPAVRRARRGSVSGPDWAWLLQDATNVVVWLAFNVTPILWPSTYRAVARLDAALVAHHVWMVDEMAEP